MQSNRVLVPLASQPAEPTGTLRTIHFGRGGGMIFSSVSTLFFYLFRGSWRPNWSATSARLDSATGYDSLAHLHYLITFALVIRFLGRSMVTTSNGIARHGHWAAAAAARKINVNQIYTSLPERSFEVFQKFDESNKPRSWKDPI